MPNAQYRIPPSVCGPILDGLTKLYRLLNLKPEDNGLYKIRIDDSHVALLNTGNHHRNFAGLEVPAATAIILETESRRHIVITAAGGGTGEPGDADAAISQAEKFGTLIWKRIRELK